MEGKIMLMNPQIILYAVIFTSLILFTWRKKKGFKKGIIVANTKYVKMTKYFKFINAKYHIYSILIEVTCILLIIISAILSARLYETKRFNEEYNNRDIMLCMDFSPSMALLNYDLITTMIKTVDSLKDERFGVTLFDSSANIVVPLTTDYNYVKYALEEIQKAFYTNARTQKVDRPAENWLGHDDYGFSAFNQTTALLSYEKVENKYGLMLYEGSSRISDGLAICSNGFKDEDRTKIVLFSTDNLGKGMLTTLEEVSNYCKINNIKVYPIGARTIENNPTVGGQANTRGDLVNLANNTGGRYFDYAKYTTDQINAEIENLNSNAVIKTTYVSRQELPGKFIPYIIFIALLLFILDWRIRI